MLDIVLLQAVSGISIPLSKWMLYNSLPHFFAASRLLLSGCICIGYYVRRGIQRKSITVAAIWVYIRMIVLGVYLKYGCKYWSLQHLSILQINMLFCCTPCIAACMEYGAGNKNFTIQQLFALFIALAASMFVMVRTVIDMYTLLPIIVMMIAIVAHCYSMMCAKVLMYKYDQSIGLVMTSKSLGAGLLCLMTSFAIEGAVPCVQSPFYFCLGLILLSGIKEILLQYLYMYNIRRYSTTFVAFTDYIGCLWSLVYSRYFLQETLFWDCGISLCIVICALYMFYQHEYASSIVVQEL